MNAIETGERPEEGDAMATEPKKPEQKPLLPSIPDYVTKCPTLLPPQHPAPVQTPVQGVGRVTGRTWSWRSASE